jgi:hypothetical protein
VIAATDAGNNRSTAGSGVFCAVRAEVIYNEGQLPRVIMFVTMDKANRDTGNIRGLNMAAVKHTTVQVSRLLL